MSTESTESMLTKKIDSKGYWYVKIRPSKYNSKRLTLEDCKDIIRRTAVSFRGWDYPFHVGQSIQPRLNFIQGTVDWHSHIELWRFYQSGQFAHKFATIEDWEPSVPEKSLSVINTLYSLTEIYEFASRLALTNVLDELPAITVELHNMNNRKLVMLDPMRHPLFDDYVCRENNLPHSEKYPTNELYRNARGIAVDHTMWILERFGWSAPHIRKMLVNDQDKLLKKQF